MKRLVYLGALLALLFACGTHKEAAPVTRRFPQTKVPALMQGQEALEYATCHYWDAFLDTAAGPWRCDSAWVAGVAAEEVEKQVGTFATILGMVPVPVARQAAEALYDRLAVYQAADTASNAFSAMIPLVSRYLYDPNSPVRLEDAYGALAERLADSPWTAPERRRSYRHEAQMCRLNATGTPAADFVFRDIRGRDHRLYGIRAPYTLLFFSNPGCPSCQEILTVLTQPDFTALVEDGTLAVVNVYIDEDLDAWRAYVSHYPRNWHTGYDPAYLIRSDVLYNVRAIPSLYLLDADKRVLLKDAPLDRLVRSLEAISQL